MQMNTYLLSSFVSIGVAGGGLINNRLLKGRVEGLYVPLWMLDLGSLRLISTRQAISDLPTVWSCKHSASFCPIRLTGEFRSICS